MGRFGLRLLMAVIGLSVLTFYLSAAALGYLLLRALWLDRPDPATTVLVVGVLALVTGYATIRFGSARMLAGLQAAELPRAYAPRLYRRLDRLCAAMELEPPRIVVAALPVPNAFAIGGMGGGTIVIDRTLLGLLDIDAVEAIVAHELAHLESRDALVQTLAISVANTLVGLLYLTVLPILLLFVGLDRGVAWLRGRPWDWGRTPFGRTGRAIERVVVLVLVVFVLLILAYSRRREFAADDRAAAVTDDPTALARALETIDRAESARGGLLSVLYTHRSEEGNADGLDQLFSSHPAMTERIDRLHRLATRNR